MKTMLLVTGFIAAAIVLGYLFSFLVMRMWRKRNAERNAFLSRVRNLDSAQGEHVVIVEQPAVGLVVHTPEPSKRAFLRGAVQLSALAFVGWAATRGTSSGLEQKVSKKLQNHLVVTAKGGAAGESVMVYPPHTDAGHTDVGHSDGINHYDRAAEHTDITIGSSHSDWYSQHADNATHHDIPHNDHC